jgi:hypothetical protein
MNQKARRLFHTGILLVSGSILEAQTVLVSGKVRDEHGYPIPFVSVISKKENKGVSTDTAGFFRIEVRPNTLLLFRAIGFEDTVLRIRDQGNLSIVLRFKSLGMTDPESGKGFGRHIYPDPEFIPIFLYPGELLSKASAIPFTFRRKSKWRWIGNT